MTEPVCRTCYAKSLTPYERERFYSEQVTMPVHYCPEHQKFMEKMTHDHKAITAKFVVHGTVTGRLR